MQRHVNSKERLVGGVVKCGEVWWGGCVGVGVGVVGGVGGVVGGVGGVVFCVCCVLCCVLCCGAVVLW